MLSEGKLEELEKVARTHLSADENTRIAWLEAELADEPNRPVYGDGSIPPCRNGHEVTELECELAQLRLQAALALISELRALRAERDAAQEELCLIGEENAGHVRLLDWVSDRLGLPHDEDVSAEHLSAVFSRLDAAEAELAALRAQAPAPVGGEVVNPEFTRELAGTLRTIAGEAEGYINFSCEVRRKSSVVMMAANILERYAALSPDPTEGGEDE